MGQYGDIKALGRAMYFASRDWIRDDTELVLKNQQDFKKTLFDIFATIRRFFQIEILEKQDENEKELYVLFSKLSKIIEGLRDRGMSGS